MLNEWVESFKAPFLSSGIDLDMSTTLKACHIRTYLNELALVSLEMKPREKEMDIELRFIKDHITINNNDSVTQTLTLQILGAVAEFESSVASERVKQKVDAKRENPFWWTGQKPRITGETWCDMVDMYYAKKPATMGGRDGHLTDTTLLA